MRILSSIIIFFVFHLSASSQQILHERVSGRPYILKTNEEIRGSLFLFEDWKPANVTFGHGAISPDLMVKFDVYYNHFFYLHNDTTYEFAVDIKEVELFPFRGDTITKMLFKKGFFLNEKITPDKFVQVLTNGKITSLKLFSKVVNEVTEYNVPGKIKEFSNSMTYYFIKDATTVSQRPSPKLLQEILKDKWPAIDAYMKQNSLNSRSEDDCIKAIKFYNTL